MIYTGYFAHQNKYISMGLFPISVAQYVPKRILDTGIVEYKKLAPSRAMIDVAKSNLGEFIDYYNEKLRRMNRDLVIEELMSISEGSDIVLLCYEKPEDFCHRHLIAEWLGDGACEFIIDSGKKSKKSENMEIEL